METTKVEETKIAQSCKVEKSSNDDIDQETLKLLESSFDHEIGVTNRSPPVKKKTFKIKYSTPKVKSSSENYDLANISPWSSIDSVREYDENDITGDVNSILN